MAEVRPGKDEAARNAVRLDRFLACLERGEDFKAGLRAVLLDGHALPMRICAWCEDRIAKELGKTRAELSLCERGPAVMVWGDPAGLVSHGICGKCFEKQRSSGSRVPSSGLPATTEVEA